jgi:carboxymethylenebutenolidase
MAGTTISIRADDGGQFSGYLSAPDSGTGPGLVLLHEIYGVNREIRATADLFAEEGYVVLAPDLFWRMLPGIDLRYDPESRKRALGFAERFDVDQGVRDIGAALTALKARPECTGKVGVLGFCLGGRLAFLAAARLDVDAAVSFYGGAIDKHLGEAGKVRCPMVLHFGGKDEHIPPPAIEQIRAAFADRPDVSIHVYPEAGHAFYIPGRASYQKPAALMAHSPTIALLRQTLGPQFDLAALWEKHCEYEFVTRDVDKTMQTMVAEPYVNHIPTMTGGVGYEQLHRFYQHHFISRLPKDTKIVSLSRTIGADRLVEELLFTFTHDTEIDFLLPGIKPTGNHVEIPMVAVVRFRGGKLYNEHIYWDQATALVQVGLLKKKKLPVAGIETAQKLLEESLPSNTLMKRWKKSDPQRQKNGTKGESRGKKEKAAKKGKKKVR